MNAGQLKQELIHRISKMENIDFLNAIITFLNHKKIKTFIELTPDQEKKVLVTSKEAKQGKLISASEMDKKASRWLLGTKA